MVLCVWHRKQSIEARHEEELWQLDAGDLVKPSDHLCAELLEFRFQGLTDFDNLPEPIKLPIIMAAHLIYPRVEPDRISVVELGHVVDAADPFHQSVDLTLQSFEAADHFVLPEVLTHLDQVIQLDSVVDLFVIGAIFGVESLRAVLQLRFQICKLWVLFEVGLAGIDLLLTFKFGDSFEQSPCKLLLLT